MSERYWCNPNNGHDGTACASCLLWERDRARDYVAEQAARFRHDIDECGRNGNPVPCPTCEVIR